MRLPRNARECGSSGGFSLLEVMIAVGIFFVAVFSILGLTSQNLAAARNLQKMEADIYSLAAELALTNVLEEGVESGNFGDLYPGYTWSRSITEAYTNGLYQVDFVVQHAEPGKRGGVVDSRLSVLLYRGGGGSAVSRLRNR